MEGVASSAVDGRGPGVVPCTHVVVVVPHDVVVGLRDVSNTSVHHIRSFYGRLFLHDRKTSSLTSPISLTTPTSLIPPIDPLPTHRIVEARVDGVCYLAYGRK